MFSSSETDRRPLPRQDLLDEIPPDPVNFLREDGEDKANQEPSPKPRPPNNRNNNNRIRQDRSRPESYRNEVDNNTGEAPSGPRNQNQRRPPQQQRSPEESNAPKRATHPQQLRSERRTAPVQSNEAQQRNSGQSPQNPNRQRRQNNRQPNKEGGEQRNNITVEITDGEVRSVKCKKKFRLLRNLSIWLFSVKSSEKTFGTGRVGYIRPESNQKFSVDTFDPNNTGENTQQQDRSPQDKSRNRTPRNRRNQKPKEFQHPTLENIVITKTSVQDRLARIAQNNEAVVQVEMQPAAAATAESSN